MMEEVVGKVLPLVYIFGYTSPNHPRNVGYQTYGFFTNSRRLLLELLWN